MDFPLAAGPTTTAHKPLYKMLYEASLSTLAARGESSEPGQAASSGNHREPLQANGTEPIHITDFDRMTNGRTEAGSDVRADAAAAFDLNPVTSLLVVSPGAVSQSPELWRLATRAKDALPNGARLENLTWRAMHMANKKREQEKQRAQQQNAVAANSFDRELVSY